MIHHSNKPSDGNLGREAGSTNQLTVLEPQIKVTQVYKDEDTAKQNAAIWDGSYQRPVFPLLESKLPKDYTLYMVMEIKYGKVREWTDMHDRVQWVGFGAHNTKDERCVVASQSTKQKAKAMALEGNDPTVISETLQRPLRLINEWREL